MHSHVTPVFSLGHGPEIQLVVVDHVVKVGRLSSIVLYIKSTPCVHNLSEAMRDAAEIEWDEVT